MLKLQPRAMQTPTSKACGSARAWCGESYYPARAQEIMRGLVYIPHFSENPARPTRICTTGAPVIRGRIKAPLPPVFVGAHAFSRSPVISDDSPGCPSPPPPSLSLQYIYTVRKQCRWRVGIIRTNTPQLSSDFVSTFRRFGVSTIGLLHHAVPALAVHGAAAISRGQEVGGGW